MVLTRNQSKPQTRKATQGKTKKATKSISKVKPKVGKAKAAKAKQAKKLIGAKNKKTLTKNIGKKVSPKKNIGRKQKKQDKELTSEEVRFLTQIKLGMVNKEDACYLLETQTKKPIPLVSIEYNISIQQSVAKFTLTQRYVNLSDNPKETVFCFPKDVDSVIHKLTCEFTLQDGTKKLLETKVEEREKAQQKYDDAISSGKSAVLGLSGKLSRDMVRIMIGQFPRMSCAELKIHFYQKLEYEDLSYCLRIPQVYIPRYLGDMSNAIKALNPAINDAPGDISMLEEEKEQLKHELNQMAYFAHKNQPLSMRIQIQSTSKITNIVSKNHNLDIELDETHTHVTLKMVDNCSNKDFVLLYRDQAVHEPVALTALNNQNQQAILVSMHTYILLPDLRAPLIRNKPWKQPENDSRHNRMVFENIPLAMEDIEEEKGEISTNVSSFDDFVEPKLREFIFLIDRSGSMHGKPIKMAVQALKLFLHSLPLGCKFNVYSFGTEFEKLFPKSQIYDQVSLKTAIQKVSKFTLHLNPHSHTLIFYQRLRFINISLQNRSIFSAISIK